MNFRLILAISIFLPCLAGASGSVIGNGGDPLFYFLEATRASFTDTIRWIVGNPAENAKFCASSRLRPEQVQACRDFLFETASQVLRLNTDPNKTLFVLRDSPLLVMGPDGQPMPVAARTQLGPLGVIEFHRESIKLLPPTQILFLIAHEFAHKVEFRGRFVTDNEPADAFASGREWIDTMASAIIDSAKRNGKIGSHFGLRDSFECRVFVNDAQFGTRTSSPRMFLSEDLMSYETSLSRNPSDSILYVPETPTSDLVFRFIAHEPANCSDDGRFDALRSTELSIVRITRSQNPDLPSKEEILVSESRPAFNPICGKHREEFSLSYENVRFVCRYFGTDGTTALLMRKGSKQTQRSF